jgi:beta-glucosidase
VARPPRELKAFTRIALAPGATRRVCFTVSSRDLSYWSSRRGWTLEPGEFIVEVGASSRDIRLAQSVVVEPEQTGKRAQTGKRERPADASR